MTNSIKQQFEVYSNALGLRNKRNEILASNIANAATPNFKAMDINFLFFWFGICKLNAKRKEMKNG